MSLHMPEGARLKRTIDLNEDRDLLFADAYGETDEALLFGDDPQGWKVALHTLIQDTDVEIAAVNAELASARYASQRRDPAKRRAELVDQKAALINRLRFVKTLIAPPGTSETLIEVFEGNKFQQAQAHVRAANRLLKQWAQEQLGPEGSLSEESP